MILSRIIAQILAVMLTSLLLALSACGPKSSLKPEYEKVNPSVVALLPIKSKEGIRSERVSFVRTALITELESRGFSLLDERAVTTTCSSAECPEREKIVERYPNLQAFVEASIDSDSKANFLAGYYNSLGGSLTMKDRKGTELLSVKHTQSERGGLLFNSGQVIQGLKDTATNFGDDRFNNIAERYVKTLVAQIPRPKVVADSADTTEFNIEKVDVREVRRLVYEICARAPAESLATLIVNKQRSTLRQTSIGRYCGIYRLDNTFTPSSVVAVEVRSPFGAADRKSLSITNSTGMLTAPFPQTQTLSQSKI